MFHDADSECANQDQTRFQVDMTLVVLVSSERNIAGYNRGWGRLFQRETKQPVAWCRKTFKTCSVTAIGHNGMLLPVIGT